LDEVRAKISSIEKYTHNEETNCKLSFDSNVVALMFDKKFDLKENIVGEGTIVKDYLIKCVNRKLAGACPR
jgi:hypothetical protein